MPQESECELCDTWYRTTSGSCVNTFVSIRLLHMCGDFFRLNMLLDVLESLSPRAMHLERVRNPVDITAVRNPCFLRAGFGFEQVSLKVS